MYAVSRGDVTMSRPHGIGYCMTWHGMSRLDRICNATAWHEGALNAEPEESPNGASQQQKQEQQALHCFVSMRVADEPNRGL